MNWILEEKIRNANKVEDAYIDENGIYRWKSNDNVPFTDMIECWTDDPKVIEACRKARDEESSAAIAEYRERMKDHEYDDEELFEMRAAFGEGETVVNVFTGKTTQL